MRRLSWVMVGITVIVGLFGCAKKREQAEPIKIGIVSPLTGHQARFGEMQKNSYDLAVEEINAKGGVLGRKLKLIYEDDMDKPEISMSAVEKLISRDKVPVVVGPYSSSATLAATTIGEKYKTPFLSPSGAHDDVTRRGYKWVFRTNAPSSVYSTTIFRFLDDVVKPKSIAIIFEDSGLGTSVAKFAKRLAEERGIKIVVYDSYSKGTPDFKPLLTRVKARNPDVVFTVAYLMDAILFMRHCRELDVNPKLFVGGGAGFTMPQFIGNLGETAEYVTVVTQWSESVKWSGAMDFYNKYKAKYGVYPDFHAATCYAAMFVLSDALERTGSLDKAKIREALAKTDMMTMFGPVKFETYEGFTNQNRHQMLILQVQDGKHVTVWPEEYATAKVRFPTPKWSERK